MSWECEKVLTERLPVRVCHMVVRAGIFLNSLNKLLIFIAIVVIGAMNLAYVSGGRG